MLKCQELMQPNSCLNKAGANEPIFVLRANDPCAPQLVRLWAAMASGLHEDDKRAEAYAWAEKYRMGGDASPGACSVQPSPVSNACQTAIAGAYAAQQREKRIADGVKSQEGYLGQFLNPMRVSEYAGHQAQQAAGDACAYALGAGPVSQFGPR
jgi:hypothetical protein